ncbi:hypothetical protein FACS189475_01770 [Betaproteobacteria bacterium]|nr:hypothetical protein FACS189475_01770 [Betaproteobacteria bacterium]
MQVEMNSRAKHHVVVHRPARATWTVFLVIWGSLALLGASVASKSGNIFFPVLWIGLAGGVVSSVLLSSVLLQWSAAEISYRSLFRTRAIRFCDIREAKISSRERGPFTPPLLLMIKPKDDRAMPIRVNLKLFSVESLSALSDVLAANGVVMTSN